LVVLDPTHLEALLAQGTITLTLNSQQEICVLTKSGGVPLSADDIMKTVMMGVQRVKEIDVKIKNALDKQALKKIVEVR
jgi:exosome complex component RRP45